MNTEGKGTEIKIKDIVPQRLTKQGLEDALNYLIKQHEDYDNDWDNLSLLEFSKKYESTFLPAESVKRIIALCQRLDLHYEVHPEGVFALGKFFLNPIRLSEVSQKEASITKPEGASP